MIMLQAFSCLSVHTHFAPCFVSSFRGIIIREKSGMYFLKYPARPLNCLTCLTVLGTGALTRASTFRGLGRTCPSEITFPRYSIDRLKKLHLSTLIENPPFCSAIKIRSRCDIPSGKSVHFYLVRHLRKPVQLFPAMMLELC